MAKCTIFVDMESITKHTVTQSRVLMTAQELAAFEKTTMYRVHFDRAVQDDPDWGWTSSGEYYVVYFKYDMTQTDLYTVGKEVGEVMAREEASREI